MSNIYYWKVIQNYYDFTVSKNGTFEEMVKDYNKYMKDEDYSFLELLNVKPNQQMRFYMDIDGIPFDKYSERDICEAIMELYDNFFHFITFTKPYEIRKDLFLKMIKLTYNKKSNTHPGYGFHIIFPFLIGDIDYPFIKYILYKFIVNVNNDEDKMYNQKHKFIYKYIDTSIYTTNRLFRSAFSCQPGLINKYKDKYLRDLNSFHTPCKFVFNEIKEVEQLRYNDYLIQNVDKNLLIDNLEIKQEDFKFSDNELKMYKINYFKITGKQQRSQNNQIFKKNVNEPKENNNKPKEDIKKIDNQTDVLKIQFELLKHQIDYFKILLMLVTLINILTVLFNLYFVQQ